MLKHTPVSVLLSFTLLQTVHVLNVANAQEIPFVRSYAHVNYDHVALREHHVTRRSSDKLTFNFEAFGRTFTPVLRLDPKHIHSQLEIETSKGTRPQHRPLTYSGHIKEDNSFIHGVLSKSGHFEGRIVSKDNVYLIERASHYFKEDTDFHTVIYKMADVTFNASLTSCAHAQLKEKQSKMGFGMESDKEQGKYKTSERIKYSNDLSRKYTNMYDNSGKQKEMTGSKRHKRAVDPTKKICELYMQADHLFYQKFGSDIDIVIEKLTQYVQVLDETFKQANIDGSGGADNIGFIIKKIKVWDDPLVEGYKYDGNFAVEYFLDLHSQVDETDSYDAFCLSYLFTYRDFSDGVLGLAWVGDQTSAGGVCEKYRTYQDVGMSLNTGIVTLLNYGTDVPSAVTHVTFAHEIGHNFGSDHDPEDDPVCTPDDDTGNYIMYARATSGNLPNNFKLSSCSISQIYPVLEAKALSEDGCFVAFAGEMCGNRVVEGTEECDCGWEDECEEGCCNPQSDNPTETPCTIPSSAVCSPSQGSCCDNACQYSADTVSCRASSDCLDEAFCTFKEHVLNVYPTGTSADCPDSAHKPNATACGNSVNSLVCYNGECSGSICLAHGREQCYCSPSSSDDWNDEKLCQVCCMDGDTCKSSSELTDVPDAKALAGQPCNNFKGYCDVFQICRQVSPEGPLGNLKKLFLSGGALNEMKDFLTEHWYLGIVAGFVLIASIAIFVAKSKKKASTAEQTSDAWVPSDDTERRNNVFVTGESEHARQHSSTIDREREITHKTHERKPAKLKTVIVYTKRKNSQENKHQEISNPTRSLYNAQKFAKVWHFSQDLPRHMCLEHNKGVQNQLTVQHK